MEPNALRWRQQPVKLSIMLSATSRMSPTHENALEVVYQALNELNLQRSKNDQLQLSPAIVLSGADSRLDSLALANLIIFTEQKVHDAFGVEIDLTEDDPFSPENGHMRTAATLASHIIDLVQRS